MHNDARAPEYKDADRKIAKELAKESLPEPVVATPQARAGVTGHNVRYVLGFGIAAVIVAFAIVYLAYVG